MAIYGRHGGGYSDAAGGASDPFAAARARLAARIERQHSARPDLPSIEELVVEIGELHPLPAVASRILALGDDQRFSAHELAAVIASDQAMTARLLRLANSAFYGQPRRIGSVRDAVVLLGFRAVRQVALATCMVASPARLTNMRYEDFWLFSITTGLLCELLAHAEGTHEDAAFTAGVMHNIGLLALDQHRPEVVAEVVGHARTQGVVLHDAERALLGYTDTDLGAALAEHWNFTPDLVEAVREHARPLHEPPPRGSLAAVVARARIFARSYGLSDGLVTRPDPPLAAVDWAVGPLELSLRRAGGLEHLVERAQAFFSAATG